MPASVGSLLNVFDGLNLGIELGLPLSCLQLGSFFDQLLFLVLTPCVLGVLVLACSTLAEVLTKHKDASLKAGLIRSLPYLLSLAFYAFPIVFSRAFQAFDCEEFDDGTRFLRADYSLDCRDAEYSRVVSLAWVAIALYPVCISLLYLTLLLAARKAILTEQPTELSRSLTFLHQDYEPSMYWWEVVETCKKVRYTHLLLRLSLPFLTTPLRASYPARLLISLLLSLADVSRRLSRIYQTRLTGATHHRLCVLKRISPLHVDRRAVPTPRPRQVQLALQLLPRDGLVLQPGPQDRCAL